MQPLTAAAQYVRMPTEGQQYSIHHQENAIGEYAREHGREIVKTYRDSGKSGITLKNRSGLCQLLRDVLGGDIAYKEILVYDVSRWGRFQDDDEAACYEFLCRKAGIPVHYCAEDFSNDGSVSSSLMKSLTRVMASEFSRELGVNVFERKKQLVHLGFWVGGPAPYGLERMVVFENDKRRKTLRPGERKSRASGRVVLIPGRDKEVECVKRMFKMALTGRIGCGGITNELNRQGFTNHGRKWIMQSVRKILCCPMYAGINTWNRTSEKLRGPTVRVAPEHWVQKIGAFAPIVDPRKFARVQIAIRKWGVDSRWSREQILDRLRRLLKHKGRLAESIILTSPGMPSAHTITKHFGSYLEAYKLAGYDARRSLWVRSEELRSTLGFRTTLVKNVLSLFPGRVSVSNRAQRPLLCFDLGVNISVLIARSLKTKRGELRWPVIPMESARDTPTLLCRMNSKNDDFLSFELFPRMNLLTFHRVKESDPWLATGRNVRSLSELYDLAQELVPRRCSAKIVSKITN